MKKIYTIFLLFISLVIQAQTTYYIDPTGSDVTGDGSISAPWKSLYKATSIVTTPGSTIHVNAGDYVETLRSDLSVGISIEGIGDESHIISKYNSDGNSWSNVLIRLYSTTQTVDGNQSISHIRLDGDNLTGQRAIYVQYRNHISIHHCTIVDFKYGAINFKGEYDWVSPPTVYSDGNRIYNNTISNSNTKDGDGSIRISGQVDLEIYNNTASQITRPEGMTGQNLIAGSFNKGTKIYKNIFYTPNTGGGAWNFVFELWNCRGGVDIYDNTFHGAGTIDIGGVQTLKGEYEYGVRIRDNEMLLDNQTVYDPHGVVAICLEAWQSVADVYVYNNHIDNFPEPIQMTLGNKTYANATFDNIFIYNNVIENVRYSNGGYSSAAIAITWQKEIAHYNNINIWNNTIIGNGTYSMAGIKMEIINTFTNISIRNNIIQGFDDAIRFYEHNGSVDSMQITNNICIFNATNTTVLPVGITTTNYTHDNTITKNPLFVSSTDYHLQKSSPAIGAGVNVGLTTDKDGVNWNKPPSIGAYEYYGNSDNHSPTIQDQGFRLNKNSPVGTVVGTVVASDPDAGQNLTYSIVSGNTNGAFAIDDLTGVLSVANSAALNVDFALVVKVQDNGVGELSSQATISINIILTGFELTGSDGAVKVYPNPVSDELIIEFKGNNDRLSFNIQNSIGQIVFNGNLSEKIVVQTTEFSPGIYLMKIENRRSFKFKKIVKV